MSRSRFDVAGAVEIGRGPPATVTSIAPTSMAMPATPTALQPPLLQPQPPQQRSLYAACLSVFERLYSFPLFEFYLFPEGEDYFLLPDAPMIDPVGALWSTFRLGAPLCMLYNQMRPRRPLAVADVSALPPGVYPPACKDCLYRFAAACEQDGFAEAADFSPSELYRDETHGFVKSLRVVQALLARIDAAGLAPPRRPLPVPLPIPHPDLSDPAAAGELGDAMGGSGAGGSDGAAVARNRARLVKELLETERGYVQALERLYEFQRAAVRESVLSLEAARSVFANLADLVDFQRRFAIQLEATLVPLPAEQRIGRLFLRNEDGFAVYQTFCANYQRAARVVAQESEALKRLAAIIDPAQMLSFLIKPVQRVCKYPLLLQELIKLTDAEVYPYFEELKDGLEAIKRVTEKVNEEERIQDMEKLKMELFERVEDWKSHNYDDFGSLLLSDKFMMRSGDRDQEYHLFLFERVLLCCKDAGRPKGRRMRINSSATSSSLTSLSSSSSSSSSAAAAAAPVTAFQLKGNIKLSNIYSIEDISRAPYNIFALRVTWSEGVSSFPFVLKGRTADQIKLWKDRLERQAQVAGESSGVPVVPTTPSMQSRSFHRRTPSRDDSSQPVPIAAPASQGRSGSFPEIFAPPASMSSFSASPGQVFTPMSELPPAMPSGSGANLRRTASGFAASAAATGYVEGSAVPYAQYAPPHSPAHGAGAGMARSKSFGAAQSPSGSFRLHRVEGGLPPDPYAPPVPSTRSAAPGGLPVYSVYGNATPIRTGSGDNFTHPALLSVLAASGGQSQQTQQQPLAPAQSPSRSSRSSGVPSLDATRPSLDGQASPASSSQQPSSADPSRQPVAPPRSARTRVTAGPVTAETAEAAQRELHELQQKLVIERRMLDAAMAMRPLLKDARARKCEENIAESRRSIAALEERAAGLYAAIGMPPPSWQQQQQQQQQQQPQLQQQLQDPVSVVDEYMQDYLPRGLDGQVPYSQPETRAPNRFVQQQASFDPGFALSDRRVSGGALQQPFAMPARAPNYPALEPTPVSASYLPYPAQTPPAITTERRSFDAASYGQQFPASTPRTPNMPAVGFPMTAPRTPNMPTMGFPTPAPRTPSMPAVGFPTAASRTPNMPAVGFPAPASRTPNMTTLSFPTHVQPPPPPYPGPPNERRSFDTFQQPQQQQQPRTPTLVSYNSFPGSAPAQPAMPGSGLVRQPSQQKPPSPSQGRRSLDSVVVQPVPPQLRTPLVTPAAFHAAPPRFGSSGSSSSSNSVASGPVSFQSDQSAAAAAAMAAAAAPPTDAALVRVQVRLQSASPAAFALAVALGSPAARSRTELLSRVLNKMQVCGLPPPLRSDPMIRCLRGGGGSGGGGERSSWVLLDSDLAVADAVAAASRSRDRVLEILVG